MANTKCQEGDTCIAMALLIQKVNNFESVVEKHDLEIDRIKDRPPQWVTVAGTIAGSLIGFLANALWGFIKSP